MNFTNNHTILQVQELAVRRSEKAVLEGIGFSLQKGEHIALIGASGSGKTSLINALSGSCFSNGSIRFAGDAKPVIAVITQQHRFRNLSNISSFYYQQRFNSNDSMDSATVKEELSLTCSDEKKISEKLNLLGITDVADTSLIQLSNGEHKRFQLAKALLKEPEWLLLDSPYTGLDVKARLMLNELLDTLAVSGMNIVLATSQGDIPSCITYIAMLGDGKMQSLLSRDEFEEITQNDHVTDTPAALISFPETITADSRTDFSVAIKMVNTNVRYHGRNVLHGINWEVKRGECWSVSGHNGSGKSTLLSLVNGDNPQAFANEIYLFDRKKGSGESIWDIKKKIGYVSPELHHYFDAGSSCFEVVASGLFDTIGLFRQLNAPQQKSVEQWMGALKISQFSRRLFNQLSNGEQRLVLLARALVKNPPLLMLDEPCQGLDAELSSQFIELINTICVQLQKTLVYVSHYEAEIPGCVTHTLKLEQGRITA